MTIPTRRDIRDTTIWTSLGAAWIFFVVVLISIIIGVLWWLGVFTAGIHGDAQVHLDQQDAKDREHWSATYNAEDQQLQADQQNLAVLKAAANSPAATQQDRINYQGAQLNCRQDTARYNADTQNLLGAQWLPTNLPTTVNADQYCGS
jgi:hypothetical protein